MGSPAELTLNCRAPASSSFSIFKDISLAGDQLERMRRHEEYLRALEEERRKIEAFKRELPFCMQLLNDAIEASREQLADYQPSRFYEDEQNAQNSNGGPVLEEFIPIRKACEETDGKSEEKRESKNAGFGNGEKPNWMNSEIVDSRKVVGNHPRLHSMSLHLPWDPRFLPRITVHGCGFHGSWILGPFLSPFKFIIWLTEYILLFLLQTPPSLEESLKQVDSRQQHSFAANPRLFLDSKHRVGGAFLPFSKERPVINPLPVRSIAERTPPDLRLSSGDHEVASSFMCNETSSLNATTSRSRSRETTEAPPTVPEKGSVAATNGPSTSPTPSATNGTQSQPQRKSRRCWSPELHRRFVNALQQLGGSQATPKQIRELMKVDGLTNDEVKSHLQKYRLHTRRPSPTPQSANPQAPQLVVLGGIWVPPEYAAHAAAAAAQQGQGLYNPLATATASQPQPHYCQPPIPQEFYSQMNPSSQLQLHHSLYCDQQQTPSHSQTSPQGPLHCNGQSSGARGTSGEGGKEESVGEDAKSDSSTWKGEEYTESTDARSMGRGLCLRKQSRLFMDGDADDNGGRLQIGKGKKIQILGRRDI